MTCQITSNPTVKYLLIPPFFNKVFDKHASHATLNKDLELINNWAFQWKMESHPDRNKQAQELFF